MNNEPTLSTCCTSIPGARDKPLFTPGPLTTSRQVKQAMLRDLGSRDGEFIQLVREVRDELLGIAGLSSEDGYECVLMQGSGTFGVEAVMTCAVPPDGKWLILENGAYGRRMATISDVNGLASRCLTTRDSAPVSPSDVERILAEEPGISAVAVVHCETTTGIMNPIQQIGSVVREHGKTYFVDSMSAFGAVQFDFRACQIDFLVSSANKCIEGVPGFSFCLARRSALDKTAGRSRTLSLDLHAQWKGLESSGQFRFTPPTHAVLAFRQALEELKLEGGVGGRQARYRANHDRLLEGMAELGFQTYLAAEHQGHIITSFRYPPHEGFTFDTFYHKLNERGYVIYPGKVSHADYFRIGNIGRIFEADISALLTAIAAVLQEMGIRLPIPPSP